MRQMGAVVTTDGAHAVNPSEASAVVPACTTYRRQRALLNVMRTCLPWSLCVLSLLDGILVGLDLVIPPLAVVMWWTLVVLMMLLPRLVKSMFLVDVLGLKLIVAMVVVMPVGRMAVNAVVVSAASIPTSLVTPLVYIAQARIAANFLSLPVVTYYIALMISQPKSVIVSLLPVAAVLPLGTVSAPFEVHMMVLMLPQPLAHDSPGFHRLLASFCCPLPAAIEKRPNLNVQTLYQMRLSSVQKHYLT